MLKVLTQTIHPPFCGGWKNLNSHVEICAMITFHFHFGIYNSEHSSTIHTVINIYYT